MGKFSKIDVIVSPKTTEREEKIINYLMKDGKKAVAKRIYNDMLKEVKLAGHMNPNSVVEAAIENAAPTIMVKSKRVGGSVYQVPVEVKPRKRLFYSIKWILEASRGKSGKPMFKRLAEELLAAYSGQGAAVKKKEEVHKMADANKAFAYMAKYIN